MSAGPNAENRALAREHHERLMREMLSGLANAWRGLSAVIEGTIRLSCANRELTLELLEASEVALEKIEPVVVALRILCGKPPRANQIVLEVANDVMAKIEVAEKNLHYGFYSSTHAEQYGYVTYLMSDGGITALTCVDRSPTAEGYQHADKVFMGMAVMFVERFHGKFMPMRRMPQDELRRLHE